MKWKWQGSSIPLATNCKSTPSVLSMQKENLQSAGGERNAELLTQVWTGDLKAICQPSREGWVWVWVIGLGQWNYSNYPWEDFAVRFWQTTAVVWGRQSNGLSGILLSPIRIRVCTPRNPPVDSWQQPGTSSQHPEPRTHESWAVGPICCRRWQPTGYPIYYKCLPLADEHWHLANGENVTEMQTQTQTGK